MNTTNNPKENKFNFSEEDKQKETVDQKKEAVKKDAEGLFKSIKTFLQELLDFREDTDRDATIEAIKNDIPFKGATAWILVCSIFVASIGLNANSTAVVIGAMLISPLMGPILGVGLSIAINDIDTLKRSLINLAIMIVLSLLTAFLFFRFFPLSEDTSELLGRVQPDIRDVLIAFFGGLALIIARTKRGTIASVIFGVAIATALMPPLCTAGYGLAKANWKYFGQAMYLFTINTIFIALATFLVLKILRFPMLKYANSAKRKRIARIASLVAIIVMIPAMFTFLSVLEESQFEVNAKQFIDKELDALPNANYIKKYATPNFKPSGVSNIELTTFGADVISDETIRVLEQRLKDYPYLNNTKLLINQTKNRQVNNLEYMEELRTRDSLDLLTQQQKITILENKVRQLSVFEKDQIPFKSLTEEININYENVEEIAYSKVVKSNFKTIDTLSVFEVKWNDSLVNNNQVEKEKAKLYKWLKFKLDVDTLLIRRVN
ncbi:putative hydrophobic protein (TIGR00271 family) [Mesoflavibacter sabulilitoris]|uniref:Uncharacterized protein n=1 Tax=Mesoflavibacter zeaxanthinifaciens subsp. sabulilitoris TaxID=1520893 RepID=A0A2T1NBP1_9FLAO|nr:DUF389 domain-containing protein [Mesoflavibacter zeaxanthinifaciens]MBB3125094.1 putative hydrophobic protein (TIGR00271 family) [Mesoflavibacter zeaxanthinifaciens subsp. sabulilitoris]PSG89788.1 hypothetical protein C7H61_08255 [Mesoflavibacter zeaxanthinifaciens subsp. sabulilitoris]